MLSELSSTGQMPDITTALQALIRLSRSVLKSEDDVRIRLLNHIQSSGRRGASQVSAARKLGMSVAALSRLCDQQERVGMIRRTQHPHDRRVKMLHLTPDGEMQLQTCVKARESLVLDFVRSLTIEERAILSRLSDRASTVPVQTRSCPGCRVGGC